MEKRELTVEDLEKLAALMAHSIQQIDCPECCDCGPVYQYIELSAGFYQDEWEWACLANTLIYSCTSRKTSVGKRDGGS